MHERTPSSEAVDQFIQRELDTVPHLEALLLLWGTRPKLWSAAEMGAALYLKESGGRDILQNLTRRHLAVRTASELYAYSADSLELDMLVAALEREYRRNLIRVTRMIHGKASTGVREFADAFRLKKDREP